MVLKVTHLKSSGTAVSEYLRAGLDQDESTSENTVKYFANNNAPTSWLGNLAEEWGLSGEVEASVLSDLLDGTLPSGHKIKKRSDHRLGEDFTFSAPKSVSIAALCWGDDRITTAHDNAVAETLTWIQQNMVYARHRKNGVEREYSPDVIFATFRHVDSRPVTLADGRIFVSPQLHSHCILPNICRRSDGSWGGLKVDFGEGSGLRLLADAFYQSNLSNRLRNMGIGLRESANGFELQDISEEMIQQWSPRTHQINDALAANGLSRASSTHGQRQAANLSTREAKGQYTAAELRALWSTVQHPNSYTPPQQVLPDSASNAASNAVHDMEERLAVIPTHLLTAKAILGGCAHSTADQIQEALRKNKELISLNSGQHITTAQAVANETFILENVRQSPKMPALLNFQNLDEWMQVRENDQGFRYSDDQRRALSFLTQSQDKIALGVGAAGAGKTTIMSAISQLASLSYEVVGLAPSHNSAQALRNATGRAQTLASWIANPPQPGRPKFIILDEAGMTGTPDMSSLLRTMGPQDRLLLIGDPRQLGPISAGQPFYDLLKQNQHATLNQIRRQEDEEQRSMVSSFASGDVRGGAEQLMKFVNETEDYADTLEQAANAYLNAQSQGSVVALASRRQTAAELSQKIRQKMQETGRLLADMGAVQSVERVPLTRAAMKRKPTYSKGTRIKNTRGKIYEVKAPAFILEGLAVVTVTDEDGRRQILRLDDLADEGWSIVTIQNMNITMGDQLLVTDTTSSLTLNGEIKKLRNGQILTIQNVTKNGKILATLQTGEQIILDATSPLSVSYGWAKTIHKSQGQTVDSAIVIDDGIAGGQLGYVAASRQKKSLQVFSPDPDDLESRLSAWATRSSALDYKPTDAVDQQRYENAVKNAVLEAQQVQQQTKPAPMPQQLNFHGMRP